MAAVLGFLPHRPAGQRDPSLPAGEAWVPLSRAAKGPALNGGRARAWEVACGGDLLDWKTGDGPDALGWAGLWEDSCLVSRSLAEGPGKSPGFRAPAPHPMTARLPDPAGVGPRSWTVGQAPEGAMGSLSRTRVLSGGGRGQGPHTPQGGRQRTLDCGRTARSPGSPPRVPVTRGPAGRGGGGAGGAGTHALCSSTRVGCGADGTKQHPEPRPAG